MLQNTSLIRFIVDLGRLICTWLQVNMLKEANPSFPYEAAAKKEEGSSFFFFPSLLDFPGDSERLHPRAIFVWSGLIALRREGVRDPSWLGWWS